MDIIEKARELGTMIRDSKQMANMKMAEQNVQNDEKARTILNDYSLLREEMVKALQEEREEGVVEEIKKRVMSKHTELNTYEITKNYVEASQHYESFMKQINDVITYAITGEDQCSSSDCGSCGCGGCK